MQNYRKKMLFMAILLLTTTLSYGQSPIWLIGNNTIQGPQANLLPTPSGPSGLAYAGQQAQYAANAWHNPVDGSLLFFVVDGVVYDGDGYIIRELIDQSGNGMDLKGVSELSIIPDPENCFRFYVIIDGLSAQFMTDQSSENARPRPYYAIFNLELDRATYNTNRKGEFETLPNGDYIRPLFSLVPQNLLFFNALTEGASQIAVSPLTTNDEYFVFYQSSIDLIYTFKISQNGLTYVNNGLINAKDGQSPPFNYSSPIKGYSYRSELEVVPTNNGFRLVGRTKTSLNGADEVIFKIDYSSNGVPSSASYANYLIGLPEPNGFHARVKGIEISPNAQYVYFTHTTSSSAPNALVCLDINTMTPVSLPLITNAQAELFKYSMIEESGNGMMLAKAEVFMNL